MFICDCHGDTLTKIAFNPDANLDITFDHAQKGGLGLQFLACWSGPKADQDNVQERMHRQYEATQILIDQGWTFITSPAEFVEGKPSFMLSIEGAEIFNNSLAPVEQWYLKGVRMSGITWNFENKLGTPAKLDQTKGLSTHGINVVKEMQRLGMAVDTSHLSDQGFFDIFSKTNAPPLASHSCCRALQPHFRNLTDEQIRLLITQGGYIGVNFYPPFLTDKGATINTVIDHIDHICQLGGEKHVGFGSDFDGIDEYPANLYSPQGFPLLIDRMAQRGYSPESIENIAGKNFLRYFSSIQGVKELWLNPNPQLAAEGQTQRPARG